MKRSGGVILPFIELRERERINYQQLQEFHPFIHIVIISHHNTLQSTVLIT